MLWPKAWRIIWGGRWAWNSGAMWHSEPPTIFVSPAVKVTDSIQWSQEVLAGLVIKLASLCRQGCRNKGGFSLLLS